MRRGKKSWDCSVQRTEGLDGDLRVFYKYVRGRDGEGARLLSVVFTDKRP